MAQHRGGCNSGGQSPLRPEVFLYLPEDTHRQVAQVAQIYDLSQLTLMGARLMGDLAIRGDRSSPSPCLVLHPYVLVPWDRARGCALAGLKGKFLEAVAGWLPGAVKDLLKWALKRQEALVRALDAEWEVAVLEVEVVWRLVVGLGGASPLETDLTLYPLYGYPYIPGSALKGVTRSQALLAIGQEVGIHPLDPEALGRCRSRRARTPLEWLEVLLTHPPESREHQEARQALAGQASGALDALADRGKVFREAFGGPGSRGRTLFADGLPLPDTLRLEVDVMSPHHSKYYTRGEKPTDRESPVPVPFLVVGSSTRFRIPLGVHREAQTHGLLDLVRGWLCTALQKHGLGAKTRAGYGEMQA